jgi:hypothetical protein
MDKVKRAAISDTDLNISMELGRSIGQDTPRLLFHPAVHRHVLSGQQPLAGHNTRPPPRPLGIILTSVSRS